MYRVGVIGCRGIGNRHAQGAESLENAEVVAACDLVPEQRDEFAAQFKATNPGLEMYADYREMLEKAQLDIVTVATGDNRHTDLSGGRRRSRCQGDLLRKTAGHQRRGRRPHGGGRGKPQRLAVRRPHSSLVSRLASLPRTSGRGRDWRRESGLVRTLRHAINAVPQRYPPARRHHVVRRQ